MKLLTYEVNQNKPLYFVPNGTIMHPAFNKINVDRARNLDDFAVAVA